MIAPAPTPDPGPRVTYRIDHDAPLDGDLIEAVADLLIGIGQRRAAEAAEKTTSTET